MTFKLVFVCLMALGAFGDEYFTPESDQYILSGLNSLLKPFVGDLLFDGPASVSNAPTPLNKNKLPTLEQMEYYMYYAGSTYYGYELDDLSCEYCLKFSDAVIDHKVLTNDFYDTVALITLTSDEIVVAFRGTLNLWNVLLDVFFVPGRCSVAVNDIKIHQGFYFAVMSLYEDMVRSVSAYLNDCPNCKVVIAGHSLGGAMARLAYFFLKDTNQFPTVTYELYTYGEPRVGNKPFAELMNSQPITTARVVARADAVPHVPPTAVLAEQLLGYYVHPQTEFWINGTENMKFCNDRYAEDPKCSMSMGPVYTVVDHLLYFDTNLGSVFGQPLSLASLPLGLFNPVKVLPPLPKKIENLFGAAASEGLGKSSPAFG